MNNEITVKQENLIDNEKTFCSINLQNMEEKKNLFNKLQRADALLNDCVGTGIKLKHVYISKYNKLNEETGEVEDKVRIILFDENGMTYATGSFGIYNILIEIMSIFGTPNNWSEPLTVKVVKVPIKNNKQILSLEIL